MLSSGDSHYAEGFYYILEHVKELMGDKPGADGLLSMLEGLYLHAALPEGEEKERTKRKLDEIVSLGKARIDLDDAKGWPPEEVDDE